MCAFLPPSVLDASRPNSLQVLGKKLVAIHNAPDDSWKIFDDRCSHHFAPLSEGRALKDNVTGKTCLQCACHGWEFQAETGKCTRVPQQQANVDKARSVQACPVRQEVGIIWVWMDPESINLAESVCLPINVVSMCAERMLVTCAICHMAWSFWART